MLLIKMFSLVARALATFVVFGAVIAPVWADIFDLRSSTGMLGTSQTYISKELGSTVTAYGFDCFGACALGTTYSATNLWGDSLSGLGIASNTNHQISPTSFVMFDWVTLKPSLNNPITLSPFYTLEGPFSDRRGVTIYFSNTLGSLDFWQSSTDVLQDAQPYYFPDFRYVAFSGWDVDSTQRTSGSFTLTTFNVPAIPEPEIYAMMMVGLGVLSILARRRKNVG